MAERERIATRPSGVSGLSSGTAQLVGAAGFVAAALLPVALWHRAIAAVATDFRFELNYLVTGWTAYTLIVLGLLFFIPVVVSIGRTPDSRLYPRSRNAYLGWGAVLYILGAGLASQVAQIAEGAAAP